MPFTRGHGQQGAVGPVQQKRQVQLLGDVRGRCDQHSMHAVALDVHPEHCVGNLFCSAGVPATFTPPGLASTAHPDLRLDDDRARDLLGQRPGLGRRGGHAGRRDRHGAANSSIAWYSNRSIRRIPLS